jgi:hypothetical protein
MEHSLNLVIEELARQVKRYRVGRLRRRETRAAQALAETGMPAGGGRLPAAAESTPALAPTASPATP